MKLKEKRIVILLTLVVLAAGFYAVYCCVNIVTRIKAEEVQLRREFSLVAMDIRDALNAYRKVRDGKLPTTIDELGLDQADLAISSFQIVHFKDDVGSRGVEVVGVSRPIGKTRLVIYVDGEIFWEFVK
jgi:hypothetical protein